MSTANRTNHSQARTVEREPQPADVLDQAIEATTQRVQSIRNTAAQFLGVKPELVCNLLRNVWRTSDGQPPLEDHEMFMGLSMVARFGLDPMAREIYVTRDKRGRLMTIVGIDGWIKILDRTEHYDGFEQELGFRDDGKIEWVETKIYSKSRKRPVTYRAFMAEYSEVGGFMAGKLPSHMLRLFSLRHAARLFTPLGGSVVSEEEARWMAAYEDAAPSGTKQRLAELTDKILEHRQMQPADPPAADRDAAENFRQEETPDPAPPEPTLEPDPAEAQMAADALAFEFQQAIGQAGTEMEVVSQKDALVAALKAKRITDQAYKSLDELCDVRRKEFRGAGKRK